MQEISKKITVPLERFQITFTANGRNDHVTMFTLYLPLAVFSFSVKSSSFVLASKVRIVFALFSSVYYVCARNCQSNSHLPFAMNAILNVYYLSCLLVTEVFFLFFS